MVETGLLVVNNIFLLAKRPGKQIARGQNKELIAAIRENILSLPARRLRKSRPRDLSRQR